MEQEQRIEQLEKALIEAQQDIQKLQERLKTLEMNVSERGFSAS
jgi:uncharacterized coiled-coil protein SlyX